MRKKNNYTLWFRFLLVISVVATAQAEEESITYGADQLETMVVQNKRCRKLAGHVVLTFHTSGMVLTADQACQYLDEAEDRIEAKGNVKIVDKEGGTIQADLLTYYPKKKLAALRRNVSCTAQKATFTTPALNYYVTSKQGAFEEGGKLMQDGMVLTSQEGTYEEDKITFMQEVTLEDANYRLHCDQLCYHTKDEIAYFQGNTKIIQDETHLSTTKGGCYTMASKQLLFHQGTLTTKEIELTADCLEVFHEKDCKASGHVIVYAKAHEATLTGEQASYLEKEKKTTLTGHPLLTKMVNNETMYLRADTFIALETAQKDEEPIQEIHALNHVKLYQENLQGLANGAVYNSKAQTVHLHDKPIIWCGGYQITGEGVSLVIEAETQVKMVIDKNAFMVSADPVDNYNQIKGHTMVAYFKEGVLEKMTMSGNTESLYFILEDNHELTGMNHIRCNHIALHMTDNELDRMECNPKPTGIFYPAAMVKPEEMKLADFVWHGDQWPTKASVLEKPTLETEKSSLPS